MGLICASIYILLLILFIPFPFSSFFVGTQTTSEGLTRVDFPLAQVCSDYNIYQPFQLIKLVYQLSVYLSAILSLLMATLLGFIDDLFDVRWRHKLPIPLIASIPLLLVYYAERGNTHIVVPKPFRSMLGTVVDLGMFGFGSCRMSYNLRFRSLVLSLHVVVVDVFDEFHQYFGRSQCPRGLADPYHRHLSLYQRCVIPTMVAIVHSPHPHPFFYWYDIFHDILSRQHS